MMYRGDLEYALARGCENPHCSHDHSQLGIILAARCHPGGGTDVRYLDGRLLLTCHNCDEALVQIAVADFEPTAGFPEA